MKKFILTGTLAVAVLFSSNVNAQERSAEDVDYGPKAGSLGIGMSANPILNYFGNFFGKTTANTAPEWSTLTQDNTLVGRYFLEDNLAVRAKFNFGFMSEGSTNMVTDRSIDQSSVGFPELEEEVENKWNHSEYNFGIAGGLEWRTRFNRLHLFYGAELGLGFSGSSDKYTYGNELNPNASIPVTVSSDDAMNGGANLGVGTYSSNSRALSNKTDREFLVGLRGFFGVEYFVHPRVSLAGEFGWGFAYSMAGQSKLNYEAVGTMPSASDPSVAEIEEEVGTKDNGFGADATTNAKLFGPAGNISVNFYF